MIVKTVKVSDKGQITLPADTLRALRAKKGTEFLLVQQGDRILLMKAEDVGKRVVDELGGWEALAAPAFAEVWGSEEDDVWDEA